MMQKPSGVSRSQNERLQSVDPSGFWRFLFWLAYVLGTLGVVSCWLLALVPRSIHDRDFALDYMIRFCVGVLTLVSILMAKWLWGIKNPMTDRGAAFLIRLIVGVAWIEGAFAVVSMIAIALVHH
jgi:hypothetical protein